MAALPGEARPSARLGALSRQSVSLAGQSGDALERALCCWALRVQLQIGKNAPSERNSSRLDGVAAATFSSTYGRCRLSPDPLPARARCHSKARSHRGITAVGRHAVFTPVVRRVGPGGIVESKLRDRRKPTTGAAERDAPGTESDPSDDSAFPYRHNQVSGVARCDPPWVAGGGSHVASEAPPRRTRAARRGPAERD